MNYSHIFDICKSLCKGNSSSANVTINGHHNQVIQYINHSLSIRRMSEFIAQYNATPFYITFPRFEEFQETLLDKSHDAVRLLGLSGLGKTRLIYEIFKSQDNLHNYYCHIPSSLNPLYELKNLFYEVKEEGYVVLDNCDEKTFREVRKLRKEIRNKLKIIGVYDDPNVMDDSNCLKLSCKDYKEAVDDFINIEIPERNGMSDGIVPMIQSMAGGFPLIALKLVDSYKKSGYTTLLDEDSLWESMLGYEQLDEKKKRVLEVLALFNPIGYKDEEETDLKWLKCNVNITLLFNCSEAELDQLFDEVIALYKEKEIIEVNRCWIQVRPLPLAVWLVGKWLAKCSPERMLCVVRQMNEISDERTAKRLKRAICKRIELMQENEKAQKLYESLLGATGAFHSEEIVCSDFGSQLFLAMSVVNPVAVTECLYRFLFNQETEWVKQHIAGKVRRNYVDALERLCFSKESFDKAILLMAKLALAENERWSNNATGQFLQLFHVYLSGSESSLKQRLDALYALNNLFGVSAQSLLFKALGYVLESAHFSRTEGAEKFGYKILKDYHPTKEEKQEYWNGTEEFLKKLLNEHPDWVDSAAEIVESHASQIRWTSNCEELAYRLMKTITDIRGYEWPEMRRELLSIRKREKKRLSEEALLRLNQWISRLRSSKFYDRLMEATAQFLEENSALRGQDLIAKSESYFQDFVQSFRDNGYYENEEEVLSLMDAQSLSVGFVHSLSRQLNRTQAAKLFQTFIQCLKHKDANYSCGFILICYSHTAYDELRTEFLQSLLSIQRYALYSELVIESESNPLVALQILSDLMKDKGLTDDDMLGLYFRNVRLTSSSQLADVCKFVQGHFKDSDRLLLKFVMRIKYEDFCLQEPMKSILFDLLLSYTPKYGGRPSPDEVSKRVAEILKNQHEPAFAKKFNQKLMLEEVMVSSHWNGVDEIYEALLPQYKAEIFEDVMDKLADKNSSFWFFNGHYLGSGFELGEGPLFRDNTEEVKARCLKEADGELPCRLAYLSPVFSEEDKTSFSPFFIWLIERLDKFKLKEEILSLFRDNYCSVKWNGPLYTLYESFIPCLQRLTNHSNLLVRKWAQNEIDRLSICINRERNAEAYRKMM